MSQADLIDVHKYLFHERKLASFMPWARQLEVALTRFSPYQQPPHITRAPRRVSSLMLANHTGINTLFERIVSQHDASRQRSAFIEQCKHKDPFFDCVTPFHKAKDFILDLTWELEEAGDADFLSLMAASGDVALEARAHNLTVRATDC